MLTFHASMDPLSLDVNRDGKRIGFLQWHPGKEPHFIQWAGDGSSVTLNEMEQILARYEDVKRENAPPNPPPGQPGHRCQSAQCPCYR